MARARARRAGVLGLAILLSGCQSPAPHTASGRDADAIARHQRRFGRFGLPRQIGMVENVGLQLPVVSPDGTQMLYLRTDCAGLRPETLLGSDDPEVTPLDGVLSVWRRPVAGRAAGERISSARWAHSPVWSPRGAALAYVVNEAGGSRIVHRAIASGEEHELGVEAARNCLPRFDGGDDVLLFCSSGRGDTLPVAPGAMEGRFRVYRQGATDAAPTVLTPPDAECVLPVATDATGVLCAAGRGAHYQWVRAGESEMSELTLPVSWSGRADCLLTWAGTADPLSPDGGTLLYYDVSQDRICALHLADRVLRQHRSGSIAACWMDAETLALATADGLYVVNAPTGASVPVFNGRWIPSRYVPEERRLVVLGGAAPRRLSIWEVVFAGEEDRT